MRLLLTALAAVLAWVATAHAVVGGRQALPEEAPWMATAGPCPGALVAPDRVVVAAHCAAGLAPERLGVRVGAVRRGAALPHPAAEVAHHPRAGRTPSPHHDVAVVALREPVAGVVPLPVATAAPVAGRIGHVFGWGATDVAGTEREPVFGPRAKDLRVGALRLLDHTACARFYHRHRPLPATVSRSMTCTVGGGTSPCLGDSGGPLVLDGALVGVFSWTHRCGDERDPGVFTRASVVRELLADPVWAPFASSRPQLRRTDDPGTLRCDEPRWRSVAPTRTDARWWIGGVAVATTTSLRWRVPRQDAGRAVTCRIWGATAGGASWSPASRPLRAYRFAQTR